MAERREYKGAAAPAKLSSDITDTATTLTIDTTSGWPTGSVGPFFVVVDPGKSTEEKIKCASRSGSTLTVATSGRGADGTSAAAHSINAVVKHVFTASDADLTNKHAADTTQDDHTQYMHNTTARTVSAPHSFTGNPTFSGNPSFTGAPTFSGTPVLSGGVDMGSSWAAAAELATLDAGAASAGTGVKLAHSNHKHALDLIALERVMWKAGDYKLTAVTGAITTEWLECNGQTVSRATYPNLFNAIGTAYGAGDGVSTFQLPDFRDYIISGAGSGGSRAIGGTGGADTVTLATGNLPSHNHGVNDPGHSHGVNDPGHKHAMDGDTGNRYVVTASGSQQNSLGGPVINGVSFSDIDVNTTGISIQSAGTGISTQNTGSGTAFSVVPRWRGARVLIKAH
jgi:microcystin-dependent protein